MITTQAELENAKKHAKILKDTIDYHEATQPASEKSLVAFTKALRMLNAIEAEICLYSIRKENIS